MEVQLGKNAVNVGRIAVLQDALHHAAAVGVGGQRKHLPKRKKKRKKKR